MFCFRLIQGWIPRREYLSNSMLEVVCWESVVSTKAFPSVSNRIWYECSYFYLCLYRKKVLVPNFSSLLSALYLQKEVIQQTVKEMTQKAMEKEIRYQMEVVLQKIKEMIPLVMKKENQKVKIIFLYNCL